MKLSLPPKIKVLEALGSIGDKRFNIINENKMEMYSSDFSKKYVVIIKENKVYSNDNGTIYKRYIGYPIIAFLMLKGILPFNQKIADSLKGIKWKELNEKYKNYQIVEKIVKEKVKEKISEKEIDEFVNNVLNELRKIELFFDESLANY